MKTIQFLVFMMLSSTIIYGQEELIDAEIYLRNGKVIQGQVEPDFESMPKLKVYNKDKKRTYSNRRVDSILVGDNKYYTNRKFLKTDFLRAVEKGTVTVLEVNGKSIGVKRNESEVFVIPTSKYHYAYSLFCNDTFVKDSTEIEESEFIKRVEAYNSTKAIEHDKPVLFDSIRRSSEIFMTRLSFFRPEAGFELKLTNGISIYNSVGINTSLGFYRDVQTFINYDYSGELRFYYNKNKRLTEGKSNYNFSGPFIAATNKYLIDVNRENEHFIGALHGWQDNNIFNAAFSSYRIGIGYNPLNSNFLVFGTLTMGWSL